MNRQSIENSKADRNMTRSESQPDYIHKVYPKQFQRNEFWNQIKRTVNGKPVSERDIHLIVSQIKEHLNLSANDHVLDLGCGNAALASHFFDQIQTYTGVDFSEYLIDIANEFFKPDKDTKYIESDIRDVDSYSRGLMKCNKILIYGCIAYLSHTETEILLQRLHAAFPNLERIFIGNVPNQNKADEFFKARKITEYELTNPQTPIGVWWEPEKFAKLGATLGFQSEIQYMPTEFYGGDYRFDIVLKT